MLHEQLIDTTNSILKRSREVSRLKGENYNIFNVLKIESDEVTVHNRFIANLLNPKGSHGMGAIFLNLFYKQILQSQTGENSLPNTVCKTIVAMQELPTKVKAEYWLGNISIDQSKGGSIDICITTSDCQIRIENKIHAGEQPKQLERYFNSKKGAAPKIIVFYLTLNGQASKSAGILKNGTHYFCLSHNNDTTKWLEACFLQASDQPILRETIKQYLILIKKLTFQTTSQAMDKELQELIIKNRANFEAANTISNSVSDAKEQVYKKIFTKIKTEVKDIANLDIKIDAKRGGRADGGFISLKQITIENNKYDIGINLELENNYFFFCMIESGKNRSSVLNSHRRFDSIANYISSKNYTCKKEGNRNGWNLYQKFNFQEEFNFLNYLDLNKSAREKLVNSFAIELAKTIMESEIAKFD
ncbi:hypothetical protein DNU06_10080 [Putridiphycobacter roseus]|uniref:PD-(D/E)XK nuclease family protein n=1 Tax=Putridiphycobacter roseus TaxID=2219161 RepID=A0A2W1NN24_9FLAO|nr:PD-(D/E)XK nuclease family protein [Putridiphycobacter roseus]PZE17082.1 hypothetical protein DNU06_10080 [Putridiphycobacter roseus]